MAKQSGGGSAPRIVQPKAYDAHPTATSSGTSTSTSASGGRQVAVVKGGNAKGI